MTFPLHRELAAVSAVLAKAERERLALAEAHVAAIGHGASLASLAPAAEAASAAVVEAVTALGQARHAQRQALSGAQQAELDALQHAQHALGVARAPFLQRVAVLVPLRGLLSGMTMMMRDLASAASSGLPEQSTSMPRGLGSPKIAASATVTSTSTSIISRSGHAARNPLADSVAAISTALDLPLSMPDSPQAVAAFASELDGLIAEARAALADTDLRAAQLAAAIEARTA